ncbi:tigger transposable element-derived protein 4-like [Belonocnema kinseyi]|uniref:tigger transposable element-derived protein 4-like n=1 Tax=Belonocnema kinseyi TaxID=2817044 RepID=UPI00143CC505|nr:tigger transposable element-derived protein 4-like [Belonocnema kinseyi]
MEKIKYTTLTLVEIVKLIPCIEKGVKRKKDIAADFKIPANSLSCIIKNKQRILAVRENSCFQSDRKRIKTSHFPLLEISMVEWMKSARNKNIPLSGPIVLEKAEFFAAHLGYKDFKATSGWLEKFENRNRIIYRTLNGETVSVSEEDYEKFLTDTLSSLLEVYAIEDIFNANETGLFFKCLPDKTLTFKGDTRHGGKKSKDSIAVMVCANIVCLVKKN